MAVLLSTGASLLGPPAGIPAGDTTFKGKKVQLAEAPTTQLVSARDPVHVAGEGLTIAGQSFPVAVADGGRLRVSTVPNGQPSTMISSGGMASLAWTNEAGKHSAALRFFVDGQGAWRYYAVNAWEYKIGGEVLRLLDANADGDFDDFAIDGCATYDSMVMLPLRKELVLGSNRVRIASIAKDGSSLVATVDPIKGGAIELAALAKLNRWRSSNGFCSVDFDPTLSKNCSAHAAYLRLHNWPGNTNPHAQDMGPEGASPEGAATAARSLISKQDALATLDAFMITYFHRMDLMSPGLERIGLNEKPEDLTVLDGREWIDKPWPAAEGWSSPAITPAPGARSVTLSAGGEKPREPVSDLANRGLPLMLLFDIQAGVSEFKGKLLERKGAKLTEIPSLLADPGDVPFLPGIVPATKLRAKTRYRAEFTYTLGGKAQLKVIEFTTD